MDMDGRTISKRIAETTERAMLKLMREHDYPAESIARGLIKAAIDISIRELTFADVARMVSDETRNHLLNTAWGNAPGELD